MDTQDTVDTQTAEQTAASASAASETSTPETVETTEQENAETKAKETEQSKPEGEESSADEEKPKRRSRSERQRIRLAALHTEIESLRAQLGSKPSGEDTAPKEADFNGDYFAYQSAKAAHDAAQAVAKQFAERDQQQAQAKLRMAQQEAAQEFFERAEEVKANIADYDQVIGAYAQSGGQFAPHVIEEIRDSEKGPLLAYELAKNPALAAELNALSPRDAAREIGRLEAKLSLPQPKKTTKAPPPIAPLGGGGSPNTQEADLNAWLKKTYGKGA